MPYRELRKLYYEDEGTYRAEYQARFHSEDAVKLDFTIAHNQAFFLENTEVLRLSLDIAERDKEVSRLCIQLPEIAKVQYSKKCLIDEIVLTNKIEGVHSSRKEIGEALEQLEQQSYQKKKHPRFFSLVNKYLKLLKKENVPLESCQDIRNIYDEIFLEEVVSENPENRPDGKIFRKEMASVYNEAEKEIHRGLYPEPEIIQAMEQALAFLHNDSIRGLYRACLFHYLIEYIHPFYDGNGRLGRFILSYCIADTLEPILAYRISETIKENIKIYYSAFQICNDPRNLADLTPFLIMQLKMIDTAIIDLRDSLKRKLIRWERYEHFVQEEFPIEKQTIQTLYSLLIQAALFSENGISLTDLKSYCGISSNTLRKMLGEIPDGLILTILKGKQKFCQMNLDVLDRLILQKQ